MAVQTEYLYHAEQDLVDWGVYMRHDKGYGGPPRITRANGYVEAGEKASGQINIPLKVDRVECIVSKMPEKLAKVLRLVYVKKAMHKDIAQHMKMPTRTVRSLKHDGEIWVAAVLNSIGVDR